MKYRYQNKNFKDRLNSARHYKRSPKKIPSAPREVFLARLGLQTWPAKIVLIIIISALVYITYIPNFLYVKKIEIYGLKEADREVVNKKINSYLSSKNFWPQKNLLFLNSAKLQNSVEKATVNVSELKGITRQYPNTLVVEFQARMPKYFITKDSGKYIIGHDGIVIEGPLANFDPSPNLVELKLKQPEGLWVPGQAVVSPKTAENLNHVVKELPIAIKTRAVKLSIESQDELDLFVDTDKDYLLKLDLRTDLNESLRNLGALISKIGQTKNIAYFDMRVPERAYICLKNTTCAFPKPAIAGMATSTISTQPNTQ